MKKRLIAIGGVLIVLAGFAFAVSNRDLLRGQVSGIPSIDTSPFELAETVTVYDDALNEYYANLAQTYANQAAEFATTAEACADSLDAYYGWNITVACSDTDGGEVYDTKGTVNGNLWYDGTEWEDIDDFCISEDQLVEYWCVEDSTSVFDGTIFGEVVECETGTSCSDGACVADPIIECTDDTDCDDGYSCSSDNICVEDEPEIECTDDDDCEFGYACSSSNTCDEVDLIACEDSDGGFDIYDDSNVSGTDFEDYDEVDLDEYCIDSDTLEEYWCPESGTYDGYLYHETYDCPNGYACQDGECIDILTDEDYECEEPFTDTNDEMVCRAYNAGIVSGKTRTSYDPYAGITRAEVIKIIILTMGEDPSYDDADILDMDEDHWAWGYVNRAKELDIITEYTFNPDVEVTRGTTMVWLVRAAGETLDRDEWEDRIPWSDMTVGNPATYAAIIANDTLVEFLDEGEVPVAQGYTDGTFRPENSILRYEALYLAYRSYLAWFEEEGTFVDPNEE